MRPKLRRFYDVFMTSSCRLVNFLYFRKWEPWNKLLLYFLKRKLFLGFRKRKPRKNSLCFRKRNFLIFSESYIQNPDIFRNRRIFRTLVYSEPNAYSEHYQTSTMESFSFNIKIFLIFSQKKAFLIFRETVSCISGIGTVFCFRRKLAKPEKQKMTADLVCIPPFSNNEI